MTAERPFSKSQRHLHVPTYLRFVNKVEMCLSAPVWTTGMPNKKKMEERFSRNWKVQLRAVVHGS